MPSSSQILPFRRMIVRLKQPMTKDTASVEAQRSSDSLLAELNDSQRTAITHVDGPLLVLAGVGSGKTRVITRRIAYLVLRIGIAPWNVLALTFTNKAAGEMRDRVANLVFDHQARAMTVCTFHSLCARLIRQYADRLGLPSGYSIYDTADQKRAIKQAMEALGISSSNFPPDKALSIISNAKNELIEADEFAASASDFFDRTIARIYKKYQQILTANHSLDFDDLLLATVRLLRQHRDLVTELQERFQYILIDEYQDTNHAQFLIAHSLAAKHKNICATGDPDQSIYAWRGANIRNILDFETHYPDATVVRLERNYRSTKSILAVADQLIQHNKHRKHKALWTDNDTGEFVRLVTCLDEREEAAWVVDQFRDLHDRHRIAWRDMAVFYRVNSLSRVIEDELRNASIPYQIARGTSFYERKEIKDAVAYLRVIANSADAVNLLRIINVPTRGISMTTIKAMQDHALAAEVNLNYVICNPADVHSLNTRAVSAVNQFAKLLDSWRCQLDSVELSLRAFVEQLLNESGLDKHYGNDKTDTDGERLMNLGELVSSAQQFEEEIVYNQMQSQTEQNLAIRLQGYLERISLVSDIDNLNANQGAITLMTLHAAKGLEFCTVAIIGLEDGVLPHQRSAEDPNAMEEERRLCFVGITRSMQHLFLTHARYRSVFGRRIATMPSRFLSELPQDHLQQEDRSDDLRQLTGDDDWPQSSRLHSGGYSDATPFSPGKCVRHPRFGLGRVLDLSTIGSQTRIRIEFSTSGVRTLILEYARLEPVSD